MNIEKEIFFNAASLCNRIAITENGNLVDFFVELPDHQRMIGNIYKGKIQNVIPGMQAAFVDIGFETNAFLPFSEIHDSFHSDSFSFDDEDDNKKIKPIKKKNIDISKQFKTNDEILVQVIKEPFGKKGARVTTDISIPGALVVLVPNNNYTGISKKINDKYEKRRLRRIVNDLKPKDFGIIVRTVSGGKDQKIIENDIKKVLKQWDSLDQKSKKLQAPSLVYKDSGTLEHVLRDIFKSDVNKLVVDSKILYNKIHHFIKETNPDQVDKINLYKGKNPLFDQHKIEDQISSALKSKVWMKSGAYIIIDHTEAMVVIDINSGRFIGKDSHENNSLKINIESVKEIAKQLKLRDIGGLVVIDFIDMVQERNRKKVFNDLKKELRKDRATVSLSEFSDFGLLEMTRERIRLNLLDTMTEECNYCNGSGRISSKNTTITRVENWLKKFRLKARDRRITIFMNSELVDYINTTKSKLIRGYMWKNLMLIDLKKDQNMKVNGFRIYSKSRKIDVTDEVYLD